MAKKKVYTKDALDTLAGDPLKVIALMLWKARHREPDMYVQITPEELQGFEDCVNYLDVVPQVNIEHPAGQEATVAVPASGKRRAVPAMPATPAKPFVIVTLTDARGDMIKPVENNQADFDVAQQAQKTQHARSAAADLGDRVLHQARTGEFSLSDIQDLVNSNNLLASA